MKNLNSHLYSFSIPMVIKKEFIDKICDINNKSIKSKINNLYFGLPQECKRASGFEQSKFGTHINSDYNYWKDIILYSIDKGFNLTYLLNSPKPFDSDKTILNKKLEKLHFLLEDLLAMGINKLRVGNIHLLEYILNFYPEFNVLTSTLFDYTQINQYINFAFLYPQVKEIVPGHEINKNFKLLKNIKKEMPDTEIELMINEHCKPGCALRSAHSLSMDNTNVLKDIFKKDIFISNCFKTAESNKYVFACKTTCIYPWEIEEYAKIGITKFKIAGRGTPEFENGLFLNYCKDYLTAIDDYNKVKNYNFDRIIFFPLNTHKNIKIHEVKNILPKISYFKKNGHLCSSLCKNECTYCYKCAKNLEKLFKRKEENEISVH